MSASESTMESKTTVNLGGPLFRRSDISHDQFLSAWRRHASVVPPWFEHFGVKSYHQFHISKDESASTSVHLTDPIPDHLKTSPENLQKAIACLENADGIAFVSCELMATEAGTEQPFGDGMHHRYFKEVIAVDERTFLHPESGASAVVPEEGRRLDIPNLTVHQWVAIASRMNCLRLEIGLCKEESQVSKGGEEWLEKWRELNQ